LNTEDKAQLNSDDEVVAQKWVLDWLEGGELVVPEDWKERVAKGEVVAGATKEWQIREHPGHMATVLAVVRDGGVFDRDAQFAEAVQTEIPSYAVLGELDGVVNEKALEKVGFKQVSVVQGAGHGVVRERVPEVTSLIGDFWRKLN
jgi:pimeloyl-ACP methyl ester carboxylesterase